MARLLLEGVTKRFGATTALEALSLDVAEGESLVLLGPSGCGKTTTLRLLAGFERPDHGVIRVGEEVVASSAVFVPPERRRMSVVFQNYALWPHMTVADNVAFGPQITRQGSRDEIRSRVQATLELVQLGGYDARYPHELSGGQQQRVALARALITEPQCLLLDEPLSNLDTRLREEMRFEVKRIQRELGVTMIYVTHDQSEALSLADRIVVMNHGVIEQVGVPEELYHRPRTRFVATALGGSNFLQAEVVRHEGDRARVRLLGCQEVDVPCEPGYAAAPTATVSIRPGHLRLLPSSAEPDLPAARVVESLFFGDVVQYAVRVDGEATPLKVTGPGTHRYAVGDHVRLAIDPAAPTLLAAEQHPERAEALLS